MSDYRVINRKQCKCGSTEISTEVIVHVFHAENADLGLQTVVKSPEVPVINCEICGGPTDQTILRK